MPRILDGAAIAAAIKQEVAEEVRALAVHGVRPGLAAVLVGNVAASEIYVRSKVQACAELGIYSDLIKPPEDITTEAMLDLVAALNSRDEIDGILIQLPLPRQVDSKVLLDAIAPEMVKPGATLIDVGINRITTREEFDRYFAGNAKREASFAKRGSTIVGDIHPEAFELAGAYTPVPGGVGLLTIAMLMSNTVRAAKMRRGL